MSKNPMLDIETASFEIWNKTQFARDIAEKICSHIGTIEGYMYGVAAKQLIKDPETLDHFIKHLGDLTAALSIKAIELERFVPEMRTLITTARANATNKEAGNVEK